MKHLVFIAITLFFLAQNTFAQEFRCNVSVQAQQIKGANQNLFRTMQQDIYDFMNNRKWTDHVYSMNERIECNIFIRLNKQMSSDEFEGSIQVQLKRPVFNSSYESVLLNIKDNDFRCKYVEFQPLVFNETSNRIT